MKKSMFLKLGFIPLALILSSCSSDDGTPEFVPVDTFMEADVDIYDGVNWTAERIVFNKNATGIIINGEGDDTTRIWLQIENYTGVGTYTIPPNDFPTYAAFLQGRLGDDYYTWVSGTGTVEITSDDESQFGKQVAGTFSFTATTSNPNTTNPTAQVNVTNGAFVADAFESSQ